MFTLQQLQSRHSVRSFQSIPLSDRQIQAVRAAISEVNSYLPGTRFQLFLDDDAPFAGKMGSYGVFKGARNYVAAVIDTGIAAIDRIAGYAGEKIVMTAVEQGLGTCFVGGTFSPDRIPAQMRAGETIRYIIALGVPAVRERPLARMMVSLVHRKSMNAEQFFDATRSSMTLDEARTTFPEFDDVLEAVACAPSAVNARPVRVWIDAGRNISLGLIKSGSFTGIDLGIAEFNASQVYPSEPDRLPDRTVLLPY